jgi:hypothetical protein
MGQQVFQSRGGDAVSCGRPVAVVREVDVVAKGSG